MMHPPKSCMMRIDIITLFPSMFSAIDKGVIGRAIQRGQLNIHLWNPRDYTHNKHRSVDKRPYGGGPGMVMCAQPLKLAIDATKNASEVPSPVIHLSPQGHLLTQAALQRFSKQERLILLAGRYEGVDQRLIDYAVDEQWSLGDYVLSGGELPAMVIIDGITRLLPGALHNPDSIRQDSFSNGLLDCPHYTRPEKFSNMTVPTVLKSGNHDAIARWRLKQSLGQTWLKRFDLLAKRPLSREEQQLLDEFIIEYRNEADKL